MSEIRIRAAGIADRSALIDFNAAMAWETEHKQLDRNVLDAGIARLLGDPGLGRYILALHADEVARGSEAAGSSEIAGALMLTSEWSDWRNGLFWWIQSVYVRPEFRRRGVYRSLHRHVRDAARATPDVCGIRLYVERENSNAQQTYRALGMHETVYRLYEESW